MENKPAQNIQDTFLNTVRKDKTPITIYLVSGVKLTGKIRSFRQIFRAAGKQQPGAIDLQARHFNRGEQPERDAYASIARLLCHGMGPAAVPAPAPPASTAEQR